MGYKDITEGSKTARVVAGRFIQSEKGTMGIEVAFKFKQGENEERITWVGWLTANSIQRTMTTLVDVLGFNGDDEPMPGTSDLKPGSLNTQKDVELVVEMETYEGKTNPRVKWVNNLGGGGFKAIAPATIKSQLNALGFKAAFFAARSQSDAGVVASAPAAKAHIPDEEVPF